MPFGTISVVDLKSMGSQYLEIFVEEAYGAELPPNPVIIDCGSNVGLATIWFTERYPGAAVTAIEADPDVFHVLEQNLYARGLSNVRMIHGAASKSGESVRFAADGGMGGHVDASGETIVPAVRLSSLMPAKVDLLKLDIEGSEFEVIEELVDSGVIAKVDRIVCEVHADSSQARLVAGLLERLATNGFLVSIRWAEPFQEKAEGTSPFAFFSGRRARYVMHLYAWRDQADPSSQKYVRSTKSETGSATLNV
jgi:FkbM family methyltransferase